jgi:hypothetical protein
MYKHTLIATDGSELAGKAVEAGARAWQAVGRESNGRHRD